MPSETRCSGVRSVFENLFPNYVNFNWKGKGNSTKFQAMKNISTPSATYVFPLHQSGTCNRRFKWEWLENYPGLAYSAKEDAAFCRYCVFFPRPGSNVSSSRLMVTRPFRDLKKATEKFTAHFFGIQRDSSKRGAGYELHCMCQESWLSFRSMIEHQTGDVSEQRDRQAVETSARDRKVLLSILDVVVTLGRQGLAFRGHRDSRTDRFNQGNNMGNFYKILQMRARSGDDVLQEHLDKHAKNASMISCVIPNELISICGDQVRLGILQEVQGAKFFSIIIDEVADMSRKEQLSIVLHIVDSNLDIREDFIAYINVTGQMTGAELMVAIDTEMGRCNLSMHDARGICADDAGNMRGQYGGCGPRIKRKYPKCAYLWCTSHQLNRVIVSSTKVLLIQNMMTTADKIAKYFYNSPGNQKKLEEVIDDPLVVDTPSETSKRKLKLMCRTRWVERHKAFETHLDLFPYVCNDVDTYHDM
ncbi:52 kDa repressor of the inhibitor of the protein kinase-like [Apostichopus japonicus]|uniref:52 kDa repressor of the inhibitor of the protein kinase-like n=1 Tax=Stichopus japonicus TaxID=307972 RepID=UPI003AB3887B